MTDKIRHAILSATRDLSDREKGEMIEELEIGIITGHILRYSSEIVDEILSLRISYERSCRSVQRILGKIQKKTKKTIALLRVIEDEEDETEEEKVRRERQEVEQKRREEKRQEYEKYLPDTIPIAILEGRSIKAKNRYLKPPKGINPINGNLQSASGYSIIYDQESIAWHKEHFFGVQERFLSRKKVEMLKHMPLDARMGRYLQALAKRKERLQ